MQMYSAENNAGEVSQSNNLSAQMYVNVMQSAVGPLSYIPTRYGRQGKPVLHVCTMFLLHTW